MTKYSILKSEYNKISIVGEIADLKDMVNYIIFFESYEDVDVLENCYPEELKTDIYTDGEYLITNSNKIQYVIRKQVPNKWYNQKDSIVIIDVIYEYEAIINDPPVLNSLSLQNLINENKLINIISNNGDNTKELIDSIINHFENVIVFSENNYKPEVLTNYLDNSKEITGLIVFDNMIDDSMQSDPIFKDLIYNYYKYNKYLVIITSNLYCLRPEIRCNISYNLVNIDWSKYDDKIYEIYK